MAVSTQASQKIGLLGGSFDPVHLAHIALAQAALQQLSLDEVQLLPAAQPWQRASLAASPQHRLHMLRLATQHTPGLVVNPTEIHRGGSTYTIDTLLALPPQHDYYWLMGADQLNNFCTWHRWQDIARRARLVVAQRPGSSLQVPAALAQFLAPLQRPVIQLGFSPQPVSATAIRQALAQGQLPQGWLAPQVAQYIAQKGLYQPPSSPHPAL